MAKIKKDKYFIPRVRNYMLCPCYWAGIAHTHPEMKKIYGQDLSGQMQFYSGRELTVLVPRGRWVAAKRHISEKILNDEKYLKRIEKLVLKRGGNIEVFLSRFRRINISALSFEELIDLTENIFKLWSKYEFAGLCAWYLGADGYNSKIKKILKIAEVDFAVLSLPIEMTKASKMEYEILKYGSDEKIKIGEAAEKMAKKYWWMPVGYDNVEIWDDKYFIERLRKARSKLSETGKEFILEKNKKREIERRRRDLLGKYGFNKQQLELLDKSHLITSWTDRRKELDFQLHWYLAQIFLELSRRYKVPFKNLKYSLLDELCDLEIDKRRLLDVSNQRINNDVLIIYENGCLRFGSSKEVEKIKVEIGGRISAQEVEGTVASRGRKNIYRARIKVLMSSLDQEKVAEGDLIVAGMTTPEYIPSMKKAIGFVTDEGGVTCHAAIFNSVCDR